MHIVVTGGKGFIGKNLLLHLQEKKEHTVFPFDLGDDAQKLEQELKRADAVIHLAGVNRPKDPKEFRDGNVDFAEQVLGVLRSSGRRPFFILSSSVQAALENPYGLSKRDAEEAVLRFGVETGAQVFVFRLQNVYGKWCRPFYNSVVATFCHQVAHGEPISIDAPQKVIEFVYVDDVVRAFLDAAEGKELNADKQPDERYLIRDTSSVSLARLAETLQSFAAMKRDYILPDFSDPFVKNLYATYLSYVEPEAHLYHAIKKEDQRGYLFEVVKSENSGQIFFSRTKPGITRGNHYHHTKIEKFCVVEGRARVAFRRLTDDYSWEFIVEGSECSIIDIPPGCTHAITNIGTTDLLTLFWSDEVFRPEAPDTYFREVNRE